MSPRTRRILSILCVNLLLTLALLTVIEIFARHREQDAGNRKLPPKGASELRVFAFGGSTVYGRPVPELAAMAQLRFWLPRLYPDRDIRIFNFGHTGAATSDVLEQVTRRLADQPDLVIVITGGNEFLSPGARADGWPARFHQTLLAHSATLRLLQLREERVMASRKEFVMPCQVAPWDRESAVFVRRMAGFEEDLKVIVQRVSERGIKLILGTLPSNLAEWPPVYKRLADRNQQYLDAVAQIRNLTRAGKYREATDTLDAAFSIYSGDAMLYFLRGQLQSNMGNYAEARESFVKARDLDPVPWRTSEQINDIIRRVASQNAGVELLDLDKIYAEHSPNGLVGFDLLADNAHSTPLGESLSAKAIIEAMIKVGFLPPSPKVTEECCPVDTFLASDGFLQPKSPLHLQYLLENATYVMKSPFLNYEASRRYLLEAMAVDDQSWKVWANLATLSYFMGDKDAGGKELQRATELHRGPLNVNDRHATPYLKEAIEYADSGANTCGTPY